MTNFFKKNTFFTGILIFSMLLAACGNQSSSSVDKAKVDHSNRVLTDSLGHEVTLSESPQRIIAPYLEDHLVALGIKPVAQWSVKGGSSIQDYLQESLKHIPTIEFDLPFEAVTSFNPDLIVIGSSEIAEGEKYEQYRKIAPTYIMGAEDNNWRNKLMKVGEILDQTDKAKKVLTDYDQFAKKAKEDIHNKVGNPSATVIWNINNTIYMVSDKASSGIVLYEDLGLKTPSLVKEISASAAGDWSQVSLEKFVQIDADYLFVINSDRTGNSTLLNDPLLANIPAIKNGYVYEFDQSSSWLYSGAIANRQIIENVLDSIAK
ncbi:ABC transporter substrate-binding protein [Lysinibacillus fusiformis]|uniref:ABC transporter substrate-binding protein n=1 Tax=Lysinibacillus fusiformis TaxID=28031 RepID=UPI00215A4D46|nr:ABC transporter substrate-binding protein [Lysinibacillus fusiformis]MCR8855108.1 ABC transporter substrate-binding protein [Lysinibacillus fusiformis]WKT76456.1 ABC transporter substrate-binding protein [Lysinibacillus fusiformis]